MTLEEQVHKLQVKVDKMERRLVTLESIIANHIFIEDDEDGPGEIGGDPEFYK